MLYFLHHISTNPPELCEDVRHLIHDWCHTTTCKRCSKVIGTTNGVFRMCVVGNQRLCFTCYHRLKYPVPL